VELAANRLNDALAHDIGAHGAVLPEADELAAPVENEVILLAALVGRDRLAAEAAAEAARVIGVAIERYPAPGDRRLAAGADTGGNVGGVPEVRRNRPFGDGDRVGEGESHRGDQKKSKTLGREYGNFRMGCGADRKSMRFR
jgi:hypothetical protein